MTHLQVLGVRGQHRVEALDHPIDPVWRRRQWLRDSQGRRRRHHRSQRRVGEAGRGCGALGQGAATLLGAVVPAKRKNYHRVMVTFVTFQVRRGRRHRTNSDLVEPNHFLNGRGAETGQEGRVVSLPRRPVVRRLPVRSFF